MHNQLALGNFRLRIGHLPLDYAQWASDGRSAQTLQMLIADARGIRTFDVETSKGWRDSRFQDKNRFTRAFLSVGSREEGTDLIARIGQIGDLGLVAEWKHDSEPELLRTSNIVVLGDRFPGFRGFSLSAKWNLPVLFTAPAGVSDRCNRWVGYPALTHTERGNRPLDLPGS